MTNPSIYTVGGTVQAGGGIYVPRHADNELLELCRQSIFTYILTSRQMGKSSLMVRTAERLADEDIQSVVIDLSQLGVKLTAEQWYLGLLSIIEEALMLDTDVLEWWQSRNHLGFTQRLTKFFQEVVLVEVTSPVVIFVDEIDTTLSLDFTDDFFAAIRYLYVARAQDSNLERLSFVLIGVATPGDLIRDPKRTPFNIGKRLDVTDFSFEEAMPLAEGLNVSGKSAKRLLGWVFYWTAGHPYLTQRLCSVISEQGKDSWSSTAVKHIVDSTFFGEMSQQDNNLQFVRDMLTKRAPNQDEVLTVFREIRLGRRSVVDEEQSIVKSHLKLSGVVRREDNILRLRNRIYKQVFDRKWINKNLPISLRDRREQLKPATPYIVSSLVVSLLAFAGTLYVNAPQMSSMELNINRKGFDYRNFDLNAKDPLLCRNECAKDPNCQAWTYVKPYTIQGHNPKCWLKRIIPVPTDNTCCVSGTKISETKISENNQEKLLKTLKGHSGRVYSVAFSPDGKTIASASSDRTVKLRKHQRKLLHKHKEQIV